MVKTIDECQIRAYHCSNILHIAGNYLCIDIAMHVPNPILIINVGSSSIKFAVFNAERASNAVLRGSFKNKANNTAFSIYQADKETSESLTINSTKECIDYLVKWFESNSELSIKAVGHRLVHGGNNYHLPTILTNEIIEQLKCSVPFSPEHLPNAIAAIESMREHYSHLPHIACFDTAFHWAMPEVAQKLPLPKEITAGGVRKYGFHGLSYEYIYASLETKYSDIQQKKIVIAHLGSGASMVAVKDGKSIDTTMGFTPAGGLIMSSRTGDIDPGVLIYLLQHHNYTAPKLNELLNHQSGLKGISGLSGDMQELMKQGNDTNAQLAINMFCYQAKKHLGALMATLGGIDVLVFTGGIGEKASAIRSSICTDMEYAGLQINEVLNKENAYTISSELSKAMVHVIPTDEEYAIAQHIIDLI